MMTEAHTTSTHAGNKYILSHFITLKEKLTKSLGNPKDTISHYLGTHTTMIRVIRLPQR